MPGKLIIISAPSGAGKSTIIREVLNSGINLEFSISACSRRMREGEKDGVDYYFLSAEDFRKKINEGEFLEWEEVYQDQYYGTLLSELDRIWDKGSNVLVEADVYGGLNIKKKYAEKTLSIFIMPPSVKSLEERLLKRSTDSRESIMTRVAKAKEEMSKKDEFDVVVVNDELDIAVKETLEAINEFLDKRS